MSTLVERMNQDMQLRGLSPRTQRSYTQAIRKLEQHYDKSAERITQEQIREYFLFRKNANQWSPSTATIALCAITFFYENTLKKDLSDVRMIRPKRAKKLPVVLSTQEVRRALKCIHLLHHRVCLTTIYSCGLRIKEAVRLKVPNIDSDRMFLHIHGKGSKDRYVPLPQRTLQLLREHWVTHRNPQWLFPAKTRRGHSQATCDTTLSVSTIQRAFKDAIFKGRINKVASVHSLRHSYATHLLEQGVDVRVIQQFLGHAHCQTTMIYTKLTEPAIKPAAEIINHLMADL